MVIRVRLNVTAVPVKILGRRVSSSRYAKCNRNNLLRKNFCTWHESEAAGHPGEDEEGFLEYIILYTDRTRAASVLRCNAREGNVEG